jgi:hypothetical protein
MKSTVSRHESLARGARSSKQMHVYPTEPAPHQLLLPHEADDVRVINDRHHWQGVQCLKHLFSISEMTAGQLADDEWVYGHLRLLKKADERLVAAT